jgi:hypothetical protein
MKTNLAASLLAVLGGAAALLMPGTSQAGNVGYNTGCFEPGSVKAPLITQAGHTPVAVAGLNTAAFSSLSTLVLENCNGASLATQVNADVATAVANGMTLVVYDWEPGAATASQLPGAPAATIVRVSGNQVDLAAGSPIATGPGGTLTNASLDGGSSSNHGHATSIPAGSIALVTTAAPANVIAFSYTYGAGRVVYSAIPFDCYARVGGTCDYLPAAPGIRSYFVNVLAWSAGAATTTCASEGYTGTKLEWCKNICERGYTGSTLAMWIRRWTDRYRTLPYCALAPQPE